VNDDELKWSNSMPDFVEGFLSNYSEDVQAISKKLRDLARHEMKHAQEFLYYNAITYSLTSSFLDRICYIRPLTSKVTLGFLYGRQLNDPDHILQGIGKRSRYVRIRTIDEVKRSSVKDLVKAAWRDGAEAVRAMKEERKKHRADRRSHSASHRSSARARRPNIIGRRA